MKEKKEDKNKEKINQIERKKKTRNFANASKADKAMTD